MEEILGLFATLDITHGWGGVLLDSSIKGTLLLMTAFVASALLRNASAASRHLLWSTTFIGVVALPLLVFALPPARLPVLPAHANASPAPPEPRMAPPTASPADTSPTIAASTEVAPLAAAAPTHPHLDRQGILLLVWAAGALASLLPLAAGVVMLQITVRRAKRVTGGDAFVLLGEILGAFDSAHPVRLLRSERISVPMAWGFLRPVVILPAASEGWPRERLRIVLLHELAHIQRWDYLTHVCARVACALYWFNPLAWLGLRNALSLREQACDDMVLGAGARPSDYAGHMLEIAREVRSTRLLAPAAILMARSTKIETRLRAILDKARDRRTISMKDAIVATCVALCVVLPLAAVRAVAAPAQDSSAPAAKAAPAEKEQTLLKHDTGVMKGKKSIATSGHFAGFALPSGGKWYLTAIQIYASRYGLPAPPKEDWTITVCDKDFKTVCSIKKPYSIFERGAERWYRIELPPLEIPAGQGGFWLNVDFNPHETKGVLVAYDGGADTSYSRMGLPDGTPDKMPDGNWMMRAIVTQDPPATVSADLGHWTKPVALASPEELGLTELKNDTGASTGKQSMGGNGPAVSFTNVPGGATLERIRIYGSRYGAGYNAAKTVVDYVIYDDEGRTLGQGKFPYSVFTYEPKWVDVAIDHIAVKGPFSIFLNPYATQYKGVYFHYDGNVKESHSMYGPRPEQLTDVGEGWNWMIRAYVALPGEATKTEGK